MATQNGILSLRTQDFLGDEASKPLYVTFSDAQTVAALITYAQTIQTTYDGVLDGIITACELKINIPLVGGIRTTPNLGSSLNDNALFNYKIAGLTNRSYGDDVPTWSQTLITNGLIRLDLAATIAYQTLFTPASGLLQPVSSDWQTLGAFRKCRLSTRKHRGALTKSSTETP